MSISTAVTSMKDEAPYILEWVAYHRAVGFDRIVVLANDCTDGTHEILQRLHEIGVITYIENVVPLGAKPHSRALKLANVCEDVTTADYVMVLDADEFLVIKQAPHTVDFLIDKMASHSADMMVIPWRLFGSSHNESYEDRPIIDRFTQSMDAAKLPKVGVKTLFRQSKNKRLAIHFPKPLMKGGKKVEDTSDEIWIDAGGKVLDQATLTWNGGRNKIHRDFAEVAHFMIKSLDEYLLKIFRGDGLMNSNRHGVDYWRGADKNDVADLIVADNIAGFHEEYARLQSDPVLADFHEKAVKSRFERLESILANHDVQALRALLRRATSGSLTPDDIVEARRLVTHMSPSIKKEELIDGDVPHSTLLSITNAGLADAATLGKRMFEKSRTNTTMFWPEKDFAKRPLANLVEGLTRAQKNGRTANLSARWFHNYTRAESKDDWVLDEEILVVLTRDDDVILEQYPAYIAHTRDKFVEKPMGGLPPLREVIKGDETPADMQALIDAKRVNDPRARLARFIKDHPEAVVLNLDHPQDVDSKLAQIAARGPSGPLAAKLLCEVLDISPEALHIAELVPTQAKSDTPVAFNPPQTEFQPVGRSRAKPLKMYWFRRNNGKAAGNFGDELGPMIVTHLTGRTVEWAPAGECDLASIGSILSQVSRAAGQTKRESELLIWGSGLIEPDATPLSPSLVPLAVRGKKTCETLALGSLPMGDPGMFSVDLVPAVAQRYKWGVVPHYSQRNSKEVRALTQDPDCILIDPTAPVEEVLQAISSCSAILSSSLHGLIVADSYGVPCRWLNIPSHKSHEFKFEDYCSGVARHKFAEVTLENAGKLLGRKSAVKAVSISQTIKDRLADALVNAL